MLEAGSQHCGDFGQHCSPQGNLGEAALALEPVYVKLYQEPLQLPDHLETVGHKDGL